MATRVRGSAQAQPRDLTELRLPAQLRALRNAADRELPDQELAVARKLYSAKRLTATRSLRGRQKERVALSQLLFDVRSGRSRVLILRGEPGIGKTALLDDLCARADDVVMVRGAGVESEAELAFGGARGYAAPEVVGRAAWEAEFNKTTKYWTSRFPGELPATPVVPEALATDEILVDGQVVNVIHVGQGDVAGSTAFHVPSAEAVVAGDVVYNNVHMMMYEADEARREAWIASIDAIAALNPKIVVAGHKSVGASDLPENLAASQQYLRDFTTVANRGGSVEELVHGMLDLHGERDQPHTLWISARAEVARRA